MSDYDFFKTSSLERRPMVSYSSNQEDARLRRIAHLLPSKLYVDVGAGDPVVGSVTYWLYTQGWSGVLVEHGGRGEEISKVRPRDTVIVGPIWTKGANTVPGRLDEIFQDLPEVVSVLNVDVEGAAREVLESIELKTHRPAVIVVHAVLPWYPISTHEDWETVLTDAGYQFACFDGVNRFYVDAHLGRREEICATLAYPVSVHDRFVRHQEFGPVRPEVELPQSEVDQSYWVNLADQRHIELQRLRAEYQDLSVDHAAIVNSLTWRIARGFLGFLKRRARIVLTLLRWVIRQRKRLLNLAALGHRMGRTINPRTILRPWPQGGRDFLMRAVARNTHPAFLAAPDTSGHRRTDSRIAWTRIANSRRADSDKELHARIRGWKGMRSSLDRQVDFAAIAQSVRSEGKKQARFIRDSRSTRRDLVLVDGRCLQVASSAMRGIGSYATPIVEQLQAQLGRTRLVLFVHKGLPVIPQSIAGLNQIEVIDSDVADRVGWLIQLSPATEDSWQLQRLLLNPHVKSTAVVYDFILDQFPSCFLRNKRSRLINDLRREILCLYDEIWAISHVTLGEFIKRVGTPLSAKVVWPSGVGNGKTHSDDDGDAVDGVGALDALPEKYVLIAGSNEWRKNLVGGLGAVAVLRNEMPNIHAVYVGSDSLHDKTSKLGREVGLPNEVLHALPRLTNAQYRTVRARATAVVVPSFSEGLSLPVLEAIRDGTPVVASDIDAHREILGDPRWLGDPKCPDELGAALIDLIHHREKHLREQTARLDDHEHQSIEDVVKLGLEELGEGTPIISPRRSSQGERLSIGIVTVWPNQRSGIADYSALTLAPIADKHDVCFYVTKNASVGPLESKPASTFDPRIRDHDALLVVIGNSAFHLPAVEILEALGGTALCHDVRLAERNQFLQIPHEVKILSPNANELRALRYGPDAVSSLSFDYVCRFADKLVFHGELAADHVHAETGVPTAAIPFAPYHLPNSDEISKESRSSARRALNLSTDVFHIGLFGPRERHNKGTDVVLESLAWLRAFNVPNVLHVVGGGRPRLVHQVRQDARWRRVEQHVVWHDRVSTAKYRALLLAMDAGIQIPTPTLFSLSRAASDLAAFGLPSVVTKGLFDDMDLPDYCVAVPDDFSAVAVAQALIRARGTDRDSEALEERRRAYLEAHTVERYATELLRAMGIS